MSVDASLPLQKAIVARLKGDPALSALVGTSVFDQVSSGTGKPYISIGPSDLSPEIASEYEGSSERIQLDVWANPPGKVQAKRIGRAVHDSLNNASLTLDENQRLVLLEIEQTRYLVEPDGQTAHGVLIFVAHTEPTA